MSSSCLRKRHLLLNWHYVFPCGGRTGGILVYVLYTGLTHQLPGCSSTPLLNGKYSWIYWRRWFDWLIIRCVTHKWLGCADIRTQVQRLTLSGRAWTLNSEQLTTNSHHPFQIQLRPLPISISEIKTNLSWELVDSNHSRFSTFTKRETIIEGDIVVYHTDLMVWFI